MDQSLAEQFYQYTWERLACGDLVTSHWFVNQTLAEANGVSVIPVREAINRLTSEGLIEHITGAGAFVPRPSRQELDDPCVLRDALESSAPAEAVRYISDRQLHDLKTVVDRFYETAKLIEKQPKRHSNKRIQSRWLNDEKLCHQIIVDSSRNGRLAKVIRNNLALVNVFEAHKRSNPSFLTYEIATETSAAKTRLLDALRDRDPVRARQVMSDQIQRGRQVVISDLSREA
jgi:DNA-binding GntR family transcriptional regulator